MKQSESEQNPLPAILFLAILVVLIGLVFSIWQISSVKANPSPDYVHIEEARASVVIEEMTIVLGNMIFLVIGIVLVVGVIGFIKSRNLSTRSNQKVTELNLYFASKRAELDRATRLVEESPFQKKQPVYVYPSKLQEHTLH